MNLLIDELQSLVKKERFSAHMPGHGYKALHHANWYQLDTTEIDGADNLFAMQGIIKESIKDIANIYGANQSRFLVGGSSSGLLASIMAVKELGSKILVPSDAHKSVYNGIELAGFTAVKIQPNYSADGISMGYDIKAFIKALKQYPEIKSVIITTPTYYGYITDIKDLADSVKDRQGVLIVDEAHGAHLRFSSQKNKQALEMGADIVVQSAHKTLPALTQSAMIHFGQNATNKLIRNVDKYLEMLQTSSPSYVLMASVDMAVKHVHKNVDQCLNTEQMLLSRAQSAPFNKMLTDPLPDDIFKWFLNANILGYTGYQLAEYLKKHGIYCEFATLYGVLLYFNFNIAETDIDYLAECLKQIPPKNKIIPQPYKLLQAEKSGAQRGDIITVPLEQAEHKITAERVIIYPPGTVLIEAGDVIDSGIYHKLINLRDNKHTVIGVCDQTLKTIKIYN